MSKTQTQTTKENTVPYYIHYLTDKLLAVENDNIAEIAYYERAIQQAREYYLAIHSRD